MEFGALNLLERSLGEVADGPSVAPRGLAANSRYCSALAACAGLGSLSPAVLTVLGDLDVDLLTRRSSYGQNSNQNLAGPSWSRMLPSSLLPRRELAFQVALTGTWSASEVPHLEAALSEYHRRTGADPHRLVEEVHLRPYLGENERVGRNGTTPVAGTFEGSGRVGLLNGVARDPKACRRVLFHEMGHQLDLLLGNGTFVSRCPDSPFGKSGRAADYVSGYAETDPCEDFAETHEFLLEHWDAVTAQPDLFLHANGEMGRKLAFILERGYGRVFP
ncbi:MAG: hypothetical protein AB1758_29715, partial [Candidatus Eremiobacterota bacterium]